MAGALLSEQEQDDMHIHTYLELGQAMANLWRTMRCHYHPSLYSAMYADEVLHKDLESMLPKHGEAVHRYRRATAALRLCVLSSAPWM